MLRSSVTAMVIAVMLATYVRTFLVEPVRIVSGSMEPTLLPGDHILVNRFGLSARKGLPGPLAALLPVRDLQRGDVVVFRLAFSPYENRVKRCLGLPGDEVGIRDHGLWIDGRRVDESGYVQISNPIPPGPSDRLGEASGGHGPGHLWNLREDRFFCLGDHRDHSRDSRSWGPVPRTGLRGRAFLVYWSTRLGQPEEQPAGWGKIGHLLFFRLSRTRWHRCFQGIE